MTIHILYPDLIDLRDFTAILMKLLVFKLLIVRIYGIFVYIYIYIYIYMEVATPTQQMYVKSYI